MRRDSAAAPTKLGDIRPTNSEYHLLEEATPFQEFNTPAAILEFYRQNRFPKAYREFSRGVREFDVIEIQFVEPIMPSSFLVVLDQKNLPEWLETVDARLKVFLFRASPLALVALPPQ